RARLRLDRGREAGPLAVHVGHAAALAAATGLAAAGLAPWLAPAVFLVLLARSGWGLAPGRCPVRPQALGVQEVGYGLLMIVLLAVGYRVGP
ncbi:MAG TPA: prenyltransferase, partial [Vicinamibacteria bacterium]|nr:prenyltransferase [Vicinamibacteria bacterium]